MVKVFGWFYGKADGLETVEEGVILHQRNKGKNKSFLVFNSDEKKLKELFNNRKMIFAKVYSKKCNHNYKKSYGNSKYGGVYCSICGDSYDWDYRTEEDMDKLFAKFKYNDSLEDLEKLEKDVVRKKEEILLQEKKMDEWGIKYKEW